MGARKLGLLILSSLAVSLLAFLLLDRLKDIIHIPVATAQFLTIGVFLGPASVWVLWLLRKEIEASKSQTLFFRKPINLALLAINLLVSTALLVSLPQPILPTIHTLVVSPLPLENEGSNQIIITGIRKLVHYPNPESVYIELGELEWIGDNHQLYEKRLVIGDGAQAEYQSTFAGCISIFFETAPESGQVKLNFDQIEQRYSLQGETAMETEVRLCAPVSMKRLDLKWQIFIAGF